MIFVERPSKPRLPVNKRGIVIVNEMALTRPSKLDVCTYVYPRFKFVQPDTHPFFFFTVRSDLLCTVTC